MLAISRVLRVDTPQMRVSGVAQHPGAFVAVHMDETAVLRRKWQAALLTGQSLPQFEEVAVGSLGRLADSVALLRRNSDGAIECLRAGERICSDVGGAHTFQFETLEPNWSRPIAEAFAEALERREPVPSVAYDVTDGTVSRFELLALPLASRWGDPLVMLYCKERGERVSVLDATFQATHEGFLTLSPIRTSDAVCHDFQVIAANSGAAALLRRPAGELLWRKLSSIFTDESAAHLFPRLLRVLDDGHHDHLELECTDAGHRLTVRVSAALMGELLTITLTDVSTLKDSEASFRLLFESNPVPMWLFDLETLRFLSVNTSAVVHYGYTRQQFLDRTILDIRPQEDWSAVREDVQNRNFRDRSGRPARHIMADGAEIQVIGYAQQLEFCGRPAALIAVHDVTERLRAEARIAYMAHHDSLTGLPNRCRFLEHLESALPHARTGEDAIAVLCVDLDHFKHVNDTLGHPIGDLLLQAVAQRLRRVVRESDMVARLGGDEFAIVQTGVCNPADTRDFAERLVQTISRPYEIAEHKVVIGASVGISLAPEDGRQPDDLLKNADMALYRAKGDGRCTFRFFEPEMDARLQARRALELDLRHAYQAGQFEIFYQPLMRLDTNTVTGFEALLRWRHPERGLVSPADFVPLAEEIGLIVPVGAWVLRKACAEATRWPASVKLAVNLSPVQFRTRDLVQTVASALGNSGLPASRLELEITESVLLAESDINLATLNQLRTLGVSISMDDFGTGYSSLSYLRAFPFDKIKIDRSFIRDMVDNADCMAIVRAVADLGASLGMITTAEGVETAEQLAVLRTRGCTEVQGYLFSAPRPAEELAELLIRLNPIKDAKVA